jgi:rhodanese-related sulfurtransferase
MTKPAKKSATPPQNSRQIKDGLYEQVARIGKAASSPKRLELLELLCQGEMNVEQLAVKAQISVKLASSHLSVLKASSLVVSRRDGKNIFYSLAVVIDVRPETEYAAGHLPFARSIPVAELKKRIAEIPKDKTVVAYCRGPFCLLAGEAVNILQDAGHHAVRLDDGVAEWQARGLAIQR